MHLYIHIPFCKQACHYCDFHFSTSSSRKEEMIQAICNEINLQSNFLDTQHLETIYFGGGTPSLLSASDLSKIFSEVYKRYQVSKSAEITLEANPDDINTKVLQEWYDLGINRLSIGIQSFDEEQLKFLNRAHSSKEAEKCIHLARAAGFEQLTIDLIYAIPSISDDIWKENLEKTINFNLPHVSSYCLTIEEKTVFGVKRKRGKMKPINDEMAARQFELLYKTFAENGLEQYEISNFASKGQYAQHNTAYWKGEAYLGLGPSAHSFNGTFKRQWNVSNNSTYIKAINKGELPCQEEILGTKERVNELVMTGLRTKWGVDVAKIQSLEPSFISRVKPRLKILKSQGLIQGDDQYLYLTEAGKFKADGIASDLFLV